MTNDAKGNFISGMARGNKSSRYRSGHSIRRFPWGICTCPGSNYSFGINGCTTTTILETARPNDRGHSGQQAGGGYEQYPSGQEWPYPDIRKRGPQMARNAKDVVLEVKV